jgi:hypothetical protein
MKNQSYKTLFMNITKNKTLTDNTLTGSEFSFIEGPMAPSLDRSCRSLEGQFDLRVVISPKLLYSQTTV